jgi:hypothetical protein
MNREDFAPDMKQEPPHAQVAENGNPIPDLLDQLENLFR